MLEIQIRGHKGQCFQKTHTPLYKRQAMHALSAQGESVFHALWRPNLTTIHTSSAQLRGSTLQRPSAPGCQRPRLPNAQVPEPQSGLGGANPPFFSPSGECRPSSQCSEATGQVRTQARTPSPMREARPRRPLRTSFICLGRKRAAL